METIVKLGGVPEYVLDKLVGMGYFRTRTEALRAGIIELGKEYNLLENFKDIENELAVRKAQEVSAEIRSGKQKTVSFEDVLKKTGIKKSDLK